MDKDYALSLPTTSNDFNAYVDAAIINGEISMDEWYELNKIYFTKSYLSQDNPRAQLGYGGDEFDFLYSRLLIVEAINKSGTFCDCGCANGHLLEVVHKWAAGVGFELQMYGVDISEGLIEFAQKRLPEWRENFFVGNTHHYKPPLKFDFLHMRTLDFPQWLDKRAIFDHLMENYVADGGRMIIGSYNYENVDPYHQQLLDWGISPTGYAEKTHNKKQNEMIKVMWIDKSSIKSHA